jgi:hypothetical protein
MEGDYIPLEKLDALNNFLDYLIKNKEEKDNLEKYDKINKTDLLKLCFSHNDKIRLEPLLVFFDRFSDEIEKSDVAYIERFTMSPYVENREKMFFYDLIVTHDQLSYFNINFFNNKIKRKFNISNFDSEFYDQLRKYVKNLLHKEPSLIENATLVIESIETYYFGFSPKIEVKTLSEAIIDFIKGNKTSSDQEIILRAFNDSDFND